MKTEPTLRHVIINIFESSGASVSVVVAEVEFTMQNPETMTSGVQIPPLHWYVVFGVAIWYPTVHVGSAMLSSN